MHLISEEGIFGGFSGRSDGDLGLLHRDSEEGRKLWVSHPEVIRNGLSEPRYVNQVHGNSVIEVGDNSAIGCQGDGDALFTERTGTPLGVFTADCLPMLIWTGSFVAAVHAGWKGTLADIAGETVDRLVRRFHSDPGTFNVAMGPCIGPCCLEMGEEVPELFSRAGRWNLAAFSRGRKWHLDLRGLNTIQCLRRGVSPDRIRHFNECTFCLPEEYFSYRQLKGRKGSMFSFIVRMEVHHSSGGR